MIERHDSVVVTTFVRVIVPPAQLFALYVLVHGHDSPGGGFQAGVILAATSIVRALALGPEARRRVLDERRAPAVACAGVLVYLGTGILPMLTGGAFLDHAALPLPVEAVRARYTGILLVEIGVMISVAATLVLVFTRLTTPSGRS